MKQSEANEKFPEMVKQFPLPYWNLHPAIMGLVWAPQSLSQVSKVFLDPRRVKYDIVNFDF